MDSQAEGRHNYSFGMGGSQLNSLKLNYHGMVLLTKIKSLVCPKKENGPENY